MLCSEAVNFCVEYNKLTALPYLLTNQACAAAETSRRKEAKELFQQAVTLFMVCKKTKQAEKIIQEASDQYRIQICDLIPPAEPV